jgi:hypothetical protein
MNVPKLDESPAAIISKTEGTSNRATTSWIRGEERAARSEINRR